MTIAYYLKDKNRLGDWVVVLDVFRSSNTIISILDRGARAVIPVESVNDAKQLKIRNPNWLLFGERDGLMIEGFDGDSSPMQLSPDVNGRVVILTTSGGTRCINSCDDSQKVIISSFANADATINYLHAEGVKDPTFWSVGFRGEHYAAEDDFCAVYLSNLFKGQEQHFTNVYNDLLSAEGYKKLCELGKSKDLEYCTSLNISTTVPRRSMLVEENIFAFVK